MNELTTAEQTDKTTLMGRVRAGLQTWVEVGTALMELRDRKLWRDEAPDFTSFCQVHFGFSKRRANQLIEATAAVIELEPSGKHASQNGLGATENAVEPSGGKHASHQDDAKPTSARQAEALAKAPKGERAKVWQEAVATAPKDAAGKPKVTAAHVRRVVEQQDEPDDAPPPPADFPPEPFEAPAPLAEPWQDVAARTRAIVTSLEAVAADMRDAYGAKASGSEKELTHPGAKRYSWSGTIGAVNAIVAYLRDNVPVDHDAKGIVTLADRKKSEAFANSRRAS